MEQFHKRIEEIRGEMEVMKSDKYALVNPVLAALDEYVKNLYLKILCTLIWYENESSEMQELYLKRIISGMGVEDSMEEHMRRALEITAADLREFIEIMQNDGSGIKYYFALEGLLLEAMGNPARANYEYLALILELCDVSQHDLAYICAVAGSVLRQESTLFDEARQLAGKNTKQLDFYPYIRNFYAGAIVNTDAEKHYIAPDVQDSAGVVWKTEYKERKVIFENLKISIEKQWSFNGCEEIVFRNCELTGSQHFIRCHSAGSIMIEKCRFTGFSNSVFKTCSVKNLTILESEFTDCGRTTKGDARGGVIQASGESFDLLSICDSCFLGCYIAAKEYRSNYGVTGVVLGYKEYTEFAHKCRIVGNTFSDCKCVNNGSYQPAIIGTESYMSMHHVKSQDNRFQGEVTRLCERE